MPQFRCSKRNCTGRIEIGSTMCPICGKYYGIFGKHGSVSLVNKYNTKKCQGQNPRDAKVIFIGRDANFAENLSESNSIFHILLDYLDDGIKFWKNSNNPTYWRHRTNSDRTQKVHHPFLLPAYGKKDGYAYHYNFSRLGLDSGYASGISFVEIVSVPTTGYPKNDPNGKLKSLTKASAPHIEGIESDIFSGDKKGVFISNTAIQALGDFDRLSDFYQRIYDKRFTPSDDIPELCIIDNVTIYKCYHFSYPRAKTKEHKDRLVKLINDYCNLTTASRGTRE